MGLGGTNWDLLDLPGFELLGLLGGESRAASRLSCPGPAREQSTLTTLVSPTCTNTPGSQILALEIQIKRLFPDKDRSLTSSQMSETRTNSDHSEAGPGLLILTLALFRPAPDATTLEGSKGIWMSALKGEPGMWTSSNRMLTR